MFRAASREILVALNHRPYRFRERESLSACCALGLEDMPDAIGGRSEIAVFLALGIVHVPLAAAVKMQSSFVRHHGVPSNINSFERERGWRFEVGGLQYLVVVLFQRPFQRRSDGLPMPFQWGVLSLPHIPWALEAPRWKGRPQLDLDGNRPWSIPPQMCRRLDHRKGKVFVWMGDRPL